jgi:hypothetical protein
MSALRNAGWFALGALSATAVLALLASRTTSIRLIRVKSLPNVGGRTWKAWTIPPLGIFIREDVLSTPELIAHELEHWRQYEERGVFQFPIDYGLEVMRYGYHQAPLEVQARAAEHFGLRLSPTSQTITSTIT